MKHRLIVKLLAVNLGVIAFVVALMWFSIDTLAAGYFMTLMEKYHISPEPAHAMFVDAIHRYLIRASLLATALAVLLNFVLLRRILSPLTRMTQSTSEIAAGDFSSRVPDGGADEVGQLAMAFNRMAESLEQMEKMRRNLMIDVAHELRTPLTNIRGYLEALNDKVLPPSPETLALLQDETMRLVRLVEEVLEQARADAARGHLVLESLDPVALIHATTQKYSGTMRGKGLAVRVLAPSDTFTTVLADRRHLERILRNLTDNAVRYSPAGGEILVELAADSRELAIAFSNDVHDVLPEDLPCLFERFYRGEKSRSRAHGGTGVGLSIVKELIAAHGGRVGASLHEGRIRVWCTLPLASTPIVA